MSYNVNGSILSNEMDSLAGAEIKELFGPYFQTVKSDQDGKFDIDVETPETEIQISLFGYITVIMKAKDFESYIELEPATTVTGEKKESNLLLYGVVAVSVLTALYLALKKPVQPKPKQVKIA